MSTKRPKLGLPWSELRRRIDAAHEAIGRALEPSPDAQRALHEARARRLARPVVARAPEEVLRVVTFRVGPERYAIEVEVVREVAKLVDLVPVPGAPRCYYGVTTWRGEVLPVLDLRAYLGHPPRGVSDLAKLLVLGRGDRPELGVLTDAVEAVLDLERSALRPPPAAVVGASRAVLRGVTDELAAVVDGAALLEDPGLFAGRGRTDEPQALR